MNSDNFSSKSIRNNLKVSKVLVNLNYNKETHEIQVNCIQRNSDIEVKVRFMGP